MKSLSLKIAAAILLLIAPLTQYAAPASVQGAEVELSNPSPYVGEDFYIDVAIRAAQGCEISAVTLSELPPTNILARGKMSFLPVKNEGDGVFLHTVRTRVRPMRPFTMRIKPLVSVDVTSRGGTGFFTTVYKEQRQLHTAGALLTVREVPEEGRPADFKGAVGIFSVASKVTPEEVSAGDIVKLMVTVTGNGNLPPDALVLPELDKTLFKSYSPKTEVGEDGTLTVVQTLIPLSTQAVEIASASLSYFDSSVHSYQVAEAGPVRLRFREKKSLEEPDVRELIVSATSSAQGQASYSIPTGIFSAGETVAVDAERAVRLAPSESSKVLCILPAGSKAVAVEKYGPWIRVRSAGKCGWIKSGVLP